MPMTSWELERAKQQGSEAALNSASVDGIMDLTGFEETGIAPSPAMSEPKSFQKFNGFDEEGTGDSGNAKKEQTALETAMKERGPGKQGDAQEKASEVKVESEHALEEEEAWDSVDDWWALSPEDVGLHSEDYAELIQKRKERQMAAEGNREEEDDSHDFNPMWRKELFGVG